MARVHSTPQMLHIPHKPHSLPSCAIGSRSGCTVSTLTRFAPAPGAGGAGGGAGGGKGAGGAVGGDSGGGARRAGLH
eukprot:1838855-Pyramimonas_sp.AAC.1